MFPLDTAVLFRNVIWKKVQKKQQDDSQEQKQKRQNKKTWRGEGDEIGGAD